MHLEVAPNGSSSGSSSSASSALARWLRLMSDPAREPFPEGAADPTPLSEDAVVIDCSSDIRDCLPEAEADRSKYWTSYRGRRDEDGRFHGGGTCTYSCMADDDDSDDDDDDEKDTAASAVAESEVVLQCDFVHGVRQGEGVLMCPGRGISRLCGNYVEGRLQGKGKMIGTDTSVMDCYFLDGVVHGPVRRIDMKKFREFRRQLSFVGRFRHGRPIGPCWQYREGGGFLYGTPDERTGQFTGDNIAYLYPDLYTALIGRFDAGVMVAARPASLAGVSLVGGVMEARFAPWPTASSLAYSRSTRTDLGQQPLEPDPYEARMVVCRPSDVPGAGEGLFAARDLPEGTIVAFYNGVRLPFVLGGSKEDWSTSGYKIFVNADYESGERMDIPASHVSLSAYRATLGHKMNHSFAPNCSEWFADHPRFGTIPCERTTRPVAEGDELLLDYEYDPYNCPEWFRQALLSFARDPDTTEEQREAINPKYAKFLEYEC